MNTPCGKPQGTVAGEEAAAEPQRTERERRAESREPRGGCVNNAAYGTREERGETRDESREVAALTTQRTER